GLALAGQHAAGRDTGRPRRGKLIAAVTRRSTHQVKQQRAEYDTGDQAKGGAGIGVDQASLHALKTPAGASRFRCAGQAGTAEPRFAFVLAPSISILISSSEVSPALPRLTRMMTSRTSIYCPYTSILSSWNRGR